MLFLYLVGVVAGIILPLQTSINTRLGTKIKGTPFIASMASFIVGAIVLFLANLISGSSILIPIQTFTSQPYWIWLGGALGVVGLTTNIIIYPYLGAVQTVIMPILGQVVMSMLIDNFGWFQSPIYHFTVMRLIGIIILLIGVLMIVIKKNSLSNRDNKHGWQILGIIAGMFQASQTPVNGYLGIVLHSAMHAAFISFLVGAILLIIITAFTDKGYSKIKNAFGHGNPWWLWTGGALGAFYVMVNAYINPLIGTGAAVILVLTGNLVGGILFDKYGLMGTPQRKISMIQYLGIIILFVGVALVRLF